MAPANSARTWAEGLVERGVVIDALAGFVDAVEAGRGRLVVVRGAAGVGKSALVDIVSSMAIERSIRLASAAGAELETVIAFGVVHQLIDPLVRTDATIVAAGPAARAWTALETGEAVDDSIYRGLDWLMSDAFGDRPGLVIVDDLQWADEPSRRFIGYLGHRSGAGRTSVLMATRDQAQLPAGVRPDSALVIDLEPLSKAACGEIANRRLPDANPPIGRLIWEATGGNPFLVHEAIEAMIRNPELPPAETLTTSLVESARLRLAALTDHARAVVEALAVAGDDTDLALISTMCDLGSDAAQVAAVELETQQLTTADRHLALRHPLMRTAILEAIGPTRREELHRAAARALFARDASPSAIGPHLLHTRPSDTPESVDLLRLAAQAAAARGDPASARALLKRAAAEPPLPDQAHQIEIDLGRACLQLGDDSAIDHLQRAMDSAAASQQRSEAHRSLLAALLAFGRLDELDRTIDRTPAVDDVLHSGQALLVEAELISAARHSVDAGLWRAERIRRWQGRVDGAGRAGRLMLANLATQSALDGHDAPATAALAMAAIGDGELIGEQGPNSLLSYQPIWQLIAAGTDEAAARALDIAQETADRQGSPIAHIFANLFRSYLDLQTGDLRAADEHTAAALAATQELPATWMALPGVVAGVIDVDIELDRLDHAASLLSEHQLDGDLPDTTPHRLLLDARARLHLAFGDITAAYHDATTLVARQDHNPVLAEHLAPCRATAARAAIEAGRIDEAKAHAATNLRAARRWGAPRIVARALAVTARTEPPTASIPLFDEAIALITADAAALDHAQLRYQRGLTQTRLGRRQDAITDLRSALDAAAAIGATQLERQARQALHDLGLRPRRAALTGTAALTATERRVAELAARGHTNRQIAETLFVTPRTIETHLTSVYRKLDIAGRARLASAINTPTTERRSGPDA